MKREQFLGYCSCRSSLYGAIRGELENELNISPQDRKEYKILKVTVEEVKKYKDETMVSFNKGTQVLCNLNIKPRPIKKYKFWLMTTCGLGNSIRENHTLSKKNDALPLIKKYLKKYPNTESFYYGFKIKENGIWEDYEDEEWEQKHYYEIFGE